jgi:hypothetical protein
MDCRGDSVLPYRVRRPLCLQPVHHYYVYVPEHVRWATYIYVTQHTNMARIRPNQYNKYARVSVHKCSRAQPRRVGVLFTVARADSYRITKLLLIVPEVHYASTLSTPHQGRLALTCCP